MTEPAELDSPLDVVDLATRRLRAAGVEPGGAVELREHRRDDQHALVMLARIAPEQTVSPRRMLQLVADLGAGAIALVDGAYVVRFTIPAAQLPHVPIERAHAYVATLAATLATGLTTTPVSAEPALFAHYLSPAPR